MTSYQSKNFGLTIRHFADHVVIDQHVYHPALYTDALPGTVEVLKLLIPTIFDNECFNDRRVSFAEEVENTEVAHLFEHLILEQLKLLKLAEVGVADYSGETSWDWATHPRGTFAIEINCGRGEERLFDTAVMKAIEIMDQIFGLQPLGLVN